MNELLKGVNWRGFLNHVGGGAAIGALLALGDGKTNPKELLAAAAVAAGIAWRAWRADPNKTVPRPVDAATGDNPRA